MALLAVPSLPLFHIPAVAHRARRRPEPLHCSHTLTLPLRCHSASSGAPFLHISILNPQSSIFNPSTPTHARVEQQQQQH